MPTQDKLNTVLYHIHYPVMLLQCTRATELIYDCMKEIQRITLDEKPDKNLITVPLLKSA